MDEGEFMALAEAALAGLERAFEAGAPQADVQTKGEGVLEIEFEDGSKMIVNRHGAAREIWVAARSGGYHFRYDGRSWRDTRGGTELFAAVSRLASEQAGERIELRAPAG
jgi:CyaY protein